MLRPDLTWLEYEGALRLHDLGPEGPEGVHDRLTGLTCHTGLHPRRDAALRFAVTWATCRRAERGIVHPPRLAPPPLTVGGLAYA